MSGTAFVALLPTYGARPAFLAAGPVIAIALLGGLPAGLIAALAAVPLNVVLLNLVGEPGIEPALRGDRIAGAILLVIVGIVVGYLRDAGSRLSAEVARRRAAERRSSTGEARAIGVLRTSLDAIIVIDSHGRIVEFNPAAEQVLGVARGRAIGQELAELVIPDDQRSRHREGLARFRDTGFGPILGRRIEVVAQRPDGSRFTAELAITPIDAGGEVEFIGSLRDISGRIRTERLLTTRLEVSRIIAEATDVEAAMAGIAEALARGLGWAAAELWIADRPAGIVRRAASWTDGAPELVEFDRRRGGRALGAGVGIVGHAWSIDDVVWLESLEDAPEPLRSDRVGSGLGTAVAWPVRSDHVVTGVLALYSRDREPRDEAVVAVLRDVGAEIGRSIERRLADEALAASRQRLAAVAAGAPVILFALDLGGRVTLAEGRGLEATGVRPRTIVGRKAGDAFGPLVDGLLQRVANERVTATAAVELSGRRFETILSPMTDAAGEVVGIIGVGTDVTERTDVEARLRASERRLAESEKLEALGRLAGGVAHDFNNLLTAIGGYADLLALELGSDHPAREDVDQIQSATRRAAALAGQLLAFARQEALQPQRIDPNAVVADLVGLIGHLIGEHVDLVTALDPGVPSVFVDPHQLERVVVNLCLNARDAMPAGGSLTITTDTLDAAPSREPGWAAGRAGGIDGARGRVVRISVRDTGVGMDAATVERIFEPFFTTKGPGHGTGLGLPTAYGIVRQSGGELRVSSRPGEGSTFEILLPEALAVLPGGEATTARGPERAGGSGHGRTILLVEDEPAVRALAARVLERAGYRVLVATSGADALARFGNDLAVDLIVSDVVMPGLSGPDFVDRLRERRPDLPVVFMSGYPDEEIARHGGPTTGMRPGELLAKPFGPDALLDAVRGRLDGAA